MGNTRIGRQWVFRAAFAIFIFLLTTNVTAALFSRDWNDHALTLLPEKSRAQGEWRAGIDILKPNRHSGINIEIREDRSTYGFYLPTERSPQIEGKLKDGSTLHFTVPADAGDLQFDGIVKGKIASGHYAFEPNKQFAADAGKLLKTDLREDDLLKLAFARVSLAYIRGVTEVLTSAGLDDVVRLRNHGLDPDGIKAYVAAGFSNVEDLIRLRNHGVTPDYVTQARAAGYGKTADELTRLRNHGVNPDYLTGWKNSGFSLSAEEIVRLRNFGVQPEYGAAWKKAGFAIDPEGLIRARNFGVPVDFAAAVNLGDKKPSLEEIIRMRQFGINADYYRDIKQLKPDYSVDEIIRLRQYGVTTDYVKTIASTRNEFTAEQIVKLRSYGVPADYIAAVNIPDRKPLDAQAIIDLRSRGVSAETARKLRE